MAFPILTVLGAGAGIGQSVLGSIAGNRAADAANAAAKRSYKLDMARSNAEYTMNGLAEQTQYAWDRARTAQLRANEATARADNAAANGRVIENAAANYRLNAAALQDQFVVEEGLRGDEIALNYAYEQAARADQTSQEVQQYLSRINAAGLEAKSGVDTLRNQSMELQQSLAFDEQKDQLEFWVQSIAAAADDASTKAASFARQGSGNTAKRLAIEGLQALGRKVGELEIKSQDRQAKMNLFSSTMSDRTASLYAQAANESQDMMNRVGYISKRFGADTGYAESTMKKIVLPTFDLSQRQYTRELESLQLQTKNTMDNALTPYRMQTYFDPIKPMAGLRPMALRPTMQAKESLGSMVGGALLGGIKGAMKGATKKSDGTLGWV